MQIKTSATDRKNIVNALKKYLGEGSVYLGPPSFAYTIGVATVDKEGNVIVEDETKAEEIKGALMQKGLLEGQTGEDTQPEADGEPSATEVKVPLTDYTGAGIVNLINMLHAKQYLINKAIGVEGFHVDDDAVQGLNEQPFESPEDAITFLKGCENFGKGFDFEDGNIIFSGFPFSQEGDAITAYCTLAAMMVSHAREAKRISSKETIEENEKYYMRVWLVRLGLGGKGGKETRNFLLKGLKGHTAFKDEAAKEKWCEKHQKKDENNGDE